MKLLFGPKKKKKKKVGSQARWYYMHDTQCELSVKQSLNGIFYWTPVLVNIYELLHSAAFFPLNLNKSKCLQLSKDKQCH